MRNALVHAQLHALGIDKNEPHLVGRGAVEQAHDHGVDGHGFARARGAGDENMRHGGQIGGDDAAVDVFAHREREARTRFDEGFALDHVAQVNGFALVVGHLDADRALAGHALDENAFGAHGEAEVVGQAGDARVFDAGLGLELEGGDHGAGIDLHHLAAHVELGAFLHQNFGFFAQLVFAHRLRAFAGAEQRARRQLEAAHILGRDRDGAHFGVGAVVNGDFVRMRFGGAS